MKKILFILVWTILPGPGAPGYAPAPDAGERKVEHKVHQGYLESRQSPLKSEASYLVFTEREAFDRVLGVGIVAGRPTDVLPANAFQTRMVVAVIKRTNDLGDLQVSRVAATGETLHVHYKAAVGRPPASGPRASAPARSLSRAPVRTAAAVASPLVVSLPKGKYARVIFVENGKKVATVPVGN
jgi:hypothetical protein